MEPNPYLTTEIEVSYRWHKLAGACCYLTLYAVEGTGQRRVLQTKHLTCSPELLVDRVCAQVRDWSLEPFLTSCEPF